MEAWLEDADQCRLDRNLVMHSPWGLGEDGMRYVLKVGKTLPEEGAVMDEAMLGNAVSNSFRVLIGVAEMSALLSAEQVWHGQTMTTDGARLYGKID
jgi:hypothetical protein